MVQYCILSSRYDAVRYLALDYFGAQALPSASTAMKAVCAVKGVCGEFHKEVIQLFREPVPTTHVV